MIKELEALENIKHYDSRVGLHESDYDIIEKALEDIDYLKAVNENQKRNIELLIEENRLMKKAFKALAIIKEQRLIVYNPNSKCIETKGYAHDLPQECEDLLKEVLL